MIDMMYATYQKGAALDRSWEQMQESNLRLGGYGPRDLTVCPICHMKEAHRASVPFSHGTSRLFRAVSNERR